MVVESPADLISAYTTQLFWLESKLEKLKGQGISETDSTYVNVANELEWVKRVLEKAREVVNIPKKRLVMVLKSKVVGLRNKVGRVTYVNTDRGYATVSFDGGAQSHALSLKNIVVIDMPVPSMKIPSAGMVVKFKDDPEEYMAINWATEQVFVEPMTSVKSGKSEWFRYSSRCWKSRYDVETINGAVPV